MCLQASVLKALKRLEDVQEMFEKRHISLKRLSAKQTRPVQHVAPRPESSPKQPSVKNTQRTAGSQPRECEMVQLTGVLLCCVQQELCNSVVFCFMLFVCFPPALARRASDNGSKQPTEVDPNKKKITRKAKAGIKVQYVLQHRDGSVVFRRGSTRPGIKLLPSCKVDYLPPWCSHGSPTTKSFGICSNDNYPDHIMQNAFTFHS